MSTSTGNNTTGRRLAASPPVTVLTWNILCGRDRGWWKNAWPRRKVSFEHILARRPADILCCQEALSDQVAFLEAILPGHVRVGVGRDDGKDGGEHNPIFYDRGRFKAGESGTFWLSDTPERPSRTWANLVPRICTWVCLTNRGTGRAFRVGNTHFSTRRSAREKSAELIAGRLGCAAVGEPVVLAGDFNCGPQGRPRQTLAAAGLRDTAPRPGIATFHGLGLWGRSLDAVLVSDDWRVASHEVIRDEGPRGHPSDHYGVRVRLVLGGSDDADRTAWEGDK